MFWTRLVSGIVLLAVAIVTIVLDGPLLFAVLLFISLVGMFELYRATGIQKNGVNLLTAVSFAAAAAFYIMVFLGLKDLYLPVLIAGLIADLFVYVFTYPRYHADEVMTAFFGIAYVAVCLSSIFQIRNLPGGEFTVWLVFLCSWGSDTFAYCAGRLFGRHRMAPELSPKKTVEGAVGGVLGSAAAGMIYAACMIHFMHAENVRIPVYGLICVCGALISMVGDLAASAIKRNHDIKDYGRLIPGHGGILDRFDSVIAAAPGILLLALIFG